MKKFKIFLNIILALVISFGCTKSDIEDLTTTPDSEASGTFRIAATTPMSDDTKVDVNGLEVTWGESDIIKIVEIGSNGAFVVSYTYTIDNTTISESGKYAEFTGANLTSAKRYIAYVYQNSGTIESNNSYGFTSLFQCSYDYSNSGSYNPDNMGLMMQSDIFEYDGISSPTLNFNHKSSVISLEVKLNCSTEYTLESITISSESMDIFSTDILFNSYGNYVNAFNESDSSNQYGASNSIEIDVPSNVKVSSSTSYTVDIPATWNSYITTANGDFTFKIKTTDSKISTTTKPMKVLSDGSRYTAELSFDEPEDMERAALIALYNSTGGDSWTNSSNWCTDADISTWYGVTVSSSTKKVTQINLYYNNLSGTIPESIGDLTSLLYLNLGYNSLSGSIPESIGDLTNLQTLYLSYNYLSGSIPESIGDMSALRYLYFSYNTSMTGSIPESLWGISNLQYINLSYNIGLTGSIPESIGDTSSLWYLNLSYNQLSGSLPTSMNRLTNLQYIYLKYNNFTGAIPTLLETQFNWNEVAWNVVVQNDGYGFSSFPDVYLEPSTVTTITNQTINTQEYFSSNKLTCVVLWRTWCGYSTYYMSTVKELYNTYSSEGFGLISLNDESDLSTITNYVSTYSIPGHVCQLSGSDYSDGTNRIKYMPTSSSPTYAFVDSDGKVVFGEAIYQIENLSYYSRSTETKSFVENYFGGTSTEDSESTDYSKDGEVVTLQTATEGTGINLVLVGDGFIDTDMESGGVYETRMKEAMEHFFSEEPYATYRNRYNVYAVKAVSKNSGVDGVNNTTFSCEFGDGTAISGDDTKVFTYALKVPSITSTSNLLVIAVLNSYKYAGTCYMYTNDAAVAYCPIVYNDDEYFRQIVVHEAGGHGFAKLLDEYAYSGTIPSETVDFFNNYQKLWGWGANVDVTSNSSSIQWADLLADSRYSGLVGIYEGALTYEYGAYRPTDISIMRYNTGGYNPPSRKEIYRRIMVLSGGTFDYEEFVAYDAINRSFASQAYSTMQGNSVDKSTFVPLATPVIIQGSPEDYK